MASETEVKFTIPCQLGWGRIRGYDNSGNKGSKWSSATEINRSIRISAVDFTRTVSEKSREQATKIGLNVSAKASYSVFSASASSSIDNSTTLSQFLSLTKERLIRNLGVQYGNGEAEAADDHVHELTGKSADINKGHKGKYVWLIPEYTFDTSQAATGFEIRIQGNAMSGLMDLAKDAGGDYRYAFVDHDQYKDQKVTDARLIRSGSQLSAAQQVEMIKNQGLGNGWVGGVRDINENRGGDYLYLAYRLN
ncbi:hypothetical protein QBC42DRAFT_330831 [Cladorrhinum samala]|uniref:Uncharacterized protein n=1 Tax=Cladorrhinum samala TaxID=585594 RepID=A0AAV9HZ13_9PEZI|nr:hypothetical protein QBC42DRAFT_330831 [Cladorrhinum samala]